MARAGICVALIIAHAGQRETLVDTRTQDRIHRDVPVGYQCTGVPPMPTMHSSCIMPSGDGNKIM